MAIKVDKKIPLPGVKHARYPWRAMEIGDSFLVPVAPKGDAQGCQKTVSSAAGAWAERYGWKFATRIVKGGVRVWRVA